MKGRRNNIVIRLYSLFDLACLYFFAPFRCFFRAEMSHLETDGKRLHGILRVVKIALIQQRQGPDQARNLKRGIEALRRAAGEGAKLVIYPELSFLRFFPQRPREAHDHPRGESVSGPTTDTFCSLAEELKVVVVINLYEREGKLSYDSSPVIDADGTLLGVTRMVHIMDGPCFHERDYYHPGDGGAPVYETAAGKIGVAICYDRHFPEYMRALALNGADLVAIPQAGAAGEWPPGLFQAEVQTASMQNGYFCALANRVGEEECLTFAGESFVTDPRGQVIARAGAGREEILSADIDWTLLPDCPARKHFLPDRRPQCYPFS